MEISYKPDPFRMKFAGGALLIVGAGANDVPLGIAGATLYLGGYLQEIADYLKDYSKSSQSSKYIKENKLEKAL